METLEQRTGQADLTPPEIDKASIIKEYFAELGRISAISQKKTNPNKMRDMGIKAGLTHTRKAEERARKRLEESGEAVEGVELR